MTASPSPDFSYARTRSQRVRRIRLVSHLLALACAGVSILFTAGLVAYWVVSTDETILRDTGVTGIAIYPIGWPVRFASAAISAVSLACLV